MSSRSLERTQARSITVLYKLAEEAAFVIVASDQKILGMERFEGKPVIRIDITTCIKAPEAVIKKCVQATQK